MKHLTDEQLSAFLDGALPASERAECETHLAGCDACRTRLAEASALEASLGRALTHDPGESYFADFAERVGKRIAAEPRPLDSAPEAPKAPKAQRSFWSWLGSPRGLALAGSTAALLVTAGIAWLQFHNGRPSVNALRQAPSPLGAGVRKQAAPGASVGVMRALPAPTPETAPSPVTDDGVRRPDAAPGRDLDRMLEVRTLPNGEQVPVSGHESQAGGTASPPPPTSPPSHVNAFAAPATGSGIAQMKKRAVSPSAEAGAPALDEKEEAKTPPNADLQPANKDAAASSRNEAPAPAPAAVAPAPAAARFAQEPATTSQKSLAALDAGDASKLPGAIAHCGKVRDGRGREIAGAQVTAVHDGVRTARTGPDGSFCVDGLGAGDTLTVMHVGFDPYTVVMTPMTSLAITLEPVGTLGPQSTMLLGKTRAPSPSLGGALHMFAESSVAPAPDVYAGQPAGVRQLVRDARGAAAIAQRERTAASFESAAKRWAAVSGQVKGAPGHDARFHYISALRDAYQLEATADRAARLRSAYAAFLATAPDSLPERATVARWQKELGASPDH